ncbi:putative phage abortive infection protein [Niabella drilacis]|uniref:Putative phage abortive infection protein n=1 Tax=Niabella drilacis (strain DSM 25811 / CCM 8410 / CCUG 62505 / LMG 26954 / E90) TaxID=1285928 RepID=A0A1G6LHB8_NIADE|nr:putative phage abortive infection protein [Niabella drilacis]SDC42678.1 Putative phage abortive infection protein [Niabella drilacis]
MKLSSKNILFLLAVFLLITSSLLFFIGPEFIQARYYDLPSQEVRSQMGDTFGGTMGPVIAWIAAILTFAAFYIQYEANKEQRRQFAKQADDTVIERFENRFFELVRLHRENVEEQNIQDIIIGRKVFTTYYFELRYIYFVVESTHDANMPVSPLTKEELTNLAYLIFFFGIGHTTQDVFAHITPRYITEDFFTKTIERLEREKSNYRRIASEIEIARTRPGLPMPSLEDLVVEYKGKRAVFMQVYQPFTGHGTKIGHYFRHLFQTVRYVTNQENPLFSKSVKYSYIKILRAQLSNFEQIILYYNSVSLLGEAWIGRDYIKEYKLLINLPLSFADFGIEPEEKFRAEIIGDKDFFDWNTLKHALS